MEQEEDQDAARTASLYPDPPPFWQDFAPDKVASFAVLKQNYANLQGLNSGPVARIPNVPPELNLLNPPAEPEDGKWMAFEQQSTLGSVLQSLEAAGIQRLPPETTISYDGKHTDRAFELKRLAKSIILNFLELTGIMGVDPCHGDDKINDLRTLLLNFHHVLNEYRPHQAREQLIELMQAQLDAKRVETAAVRSVVDKAKSTLEGLGSIDVPAADDVDATGQNEEQVRDLRELEAEQWAEVEKALA